MSILVFVFYLSLPQHPCLCIDIFVFVFFLYICLSLNISIIAPTWLFWKCADVTGKLNSRLWTSGAFPAKSNIRFFRILRVQQFSFSILDWLDVDIRILKKWQNALVWCVGTYRSKEKDVDQLAPEYKGTQLQFGKCPLMNIFTWSTLQIRKPDFSTPIEKFLFARSLFHPIYFWAIEESPFSRSGYGP